MPLVVGGSKMTLHKSQLVRLVNGGSKLTPLVKGRSKKA